MEHVLFTDLTVVYIAE